MPDRQTESLALIRRVLPIETIYRWINTILSQIKSSLPIIAVILFLLFHGDIVVERRLSNVFLLGTLDR
jgi:hypothetical protein